VTSDRTSEKQCLSEAPSLSPGRTVRPGFWTENVSEKGRKVRVDKVLLRGR
jgi:hypothetical protein